MTEGKNIQDEEKAIKMRFFRFDQTDISEENFVRQCSRIIVNS